MWNVVLWRGRLILVPSTKHWTTTITMYAYAINVNVRMNSGALNHLVCPCVVSTHSIYTWKGQPYMTVSQDVGGCDEHTRHRKQ